jgi:hypothetical protein
MLHRLTCYEEWTVGVVRQSAADIVRHGLTGRVEWLPIPEGGTLLADPSCLVHPDGRRLLFAEYKRSEAERGEIWAAEVPAGADLAQARFKPWLREPFHLSYPQPFLAENGSVRLTAESWEAGAALIWKADKEFGRLETPLFGGGAVVDPTLWVGKDRVWLFCTFRDKGPDSHLYIFHAPRREGPWTAHSANPVKVDFSSARPAGPLFVADGVLVRPSQDCSETYGGAVVLNAVRRLDPDNFAEEALRRIEPVPGPYGNGLHTICPAGEDTLIDGKRWRYDPAILANQVRRRAAKIARLARR